MDTLLIAALVVGVLLLVVLVWAAVSYGRLAASRTLVQEAWRQIDVELQRRRALVPAVVETVQQLSDQQQGVLDEVTQAGAAAASGPAGPAAQAMSENALTSALARLLEHAQRDPQLCTATELARLQTEITTTEDRIAAGRRFYNTKVRELNGKVASFPSSIVAAVFAFRRAEYFEATDPAVRAVPDVASAGDPRPGA